MSAEEQSRLESKGLDEFGNEWVVAKAPPRKRTLEDTIALWWTALGSTVVISAAPFFILFFVDLDGGPEYDNKLKVLLAFAAGGLLGDAFLHLMPHSLGNSDGDSGEHSHDHGHSHGGEGGHGHSHNPAVINCMHWVLAGLMTFLVIEKWARVMGVGHTHGDGDDGHGHSHEKTENSDDDTGKTDETDKSGKSTEKTTEKSTEESTENTTEKTTDKPTENTTEKNTETTSFLPKMEIAGYLNLAADFSHNFTDGMAIGASYLAGNTVGMITTFTILIHEVPHEIGDFAILIKSGCPRMTAIYLQSSTAIGAMIGCCIGLSMESIGKDAINAILPFTAGGFVYIACVTVLPELLKSKGDSLKQVLMEFAALFAGIGMMVLIGFIE